MANSNTRPRSSLAPNSGGQAPLPSPEKQSIFERACEQFRSQHRGTLHRFFIRCRFCDHDWESYQPNNLECKSCGDHNDFSIKEIPDTESKDTIDVWVKLGQLNPWICGAYDPKFGRGSFGECKTVNDLKGQLERDNWSLGQAFYHGDLCFINQVNAGGEWLTIKEGTPFESMTMKFIIRRGAFEELIARIRKATIEQCRAFEY